MLNTSHAVKQCNCTVRDKITLTCSENSIFKFSQGNTIGIHWAAQKVIHAFCLCSFQILFFRLHWTVSAKVCISCENLLFLFLVTCTVAKLNRLRFNHTRRVFYCFMIMHDLVQYYRHKKAAKHWVGSFTRHIAQTIICFCHCLLFSVMNSSVPKRKWKSWWLSCF